MSDCNELNISTGCRPVIVNIGTGEYDDDPYFPMEKKKKVPAVFHTWCKAYHCPAGDGSMLQEHIRALVEMEDGSMKTVEPCSIQFDNTKDEHA